MVKRFVKYNPAFLEGDELIENFVVRQIDFRMIIRIILDNSMASNQHVLVIGPRGSGKTTLVRRVALEVERDEELNRACYPLIFAEESYNAVSAADFWLEALFHLAEQTGEAQMMRTYQEFRRDPDEQRLGERALWQLLDFADKIGKRILLVVENLDMLLSEFSDKQEAWKLRHTLMNEPRLMLLATAIGRSDEVDHPAHAMFELFKIHQLNALDDQECNMIWELIAGEKLPGEQIRPIRILTGGNARLIALIARFGAKRSFQQLLDDLVDLIDEHTDYFKSHLDAMASKERKVYLALAELWSLSTAKEVAEVARLDVNTASALLSRLVSRGKVVFEDNGKRTKWYRLSEGIYNIYYLMRRRGSPSARVNAAVKFMVSLYGPESAVKLLFDEANNMVPEQCREHIFAFEEVIKNISDQKVLQRIGLATPKIFLDSPYLSETVKNSLLIESETESINEVLVSLQSIKDIFEQVIDFVENDKYDEAIQLLEQLIVKHKDHSEVHIIQCVATAMVFKGGFLVRQNRTKEAIHTYDGLIGMYKERSEAEIVAVVTTAMFKKGVALEKFERDLKAEHAFQNAIELNPLMWQAYVELLKLLLKMPERQRDAMDLARKYVENPGLVEQSIEGAIELFVELAASGYSREALGILVDSPAAPHLEPLMVALRMMIGDEVKSAIEIQEVAKDVVKRIEARKNTMKSAPVQALAATQ